MYLSELLKEGIEVKINLNQGSTLISITGDPVSAQIDFDDFKPENGKILLKSKIILEQSNYKKIDAQIQFTVISINKNMVTLVPDQIIELNEEELDVNSSAIEFINYLPEQECLIIQFWNTAAYLYYQVPPAVYALLVALESKGKAFHSYVEGRFSSEEISDEATLVDVKKMAEKYNLEKSQLDELNKIKIFITQSEDVEKLREVFYNPKVPENMKILYLQNKNTPSEILTELYNQLAPFQQSGVLSHPNISEKILYEAAKSSEHHWHRLPVAKNQKTPEQILDHLIQDESMQVRNAVLNNPNYSEEKKDKYKIALNNPPKGYIRLPQWYIDVAHIDFLQEESKLVGDAKSMIKIIGKPSIQIVETQPKPNLGEIIMRVESNGLLTLVAHNFDSSD